MGSGAGLKRKEVEYCAGRCRVIAINDTWRAAPWADLLYACDLNWWKVHDGAPGFLNEKWTRDQKAALQFGLHYIRSEDKPGMSREPGIIYQGGTSGYQALNLALQFGAARILLLGFDYHGAHWFGAHPVPLSNARDDEWLGRARNFRNAAFDISHEWPQSEVLNCSPGSAIDAFEMGDVFNAL